MRFGKFSLYTVAGCIPWTFALAAVGYALGSQWKSVESNLRPVSIVIGLVVVAAVGWWLVREVRRRKTVGSEVE
jgi:membrane protein DedA with SNARE-associated domain